MKVGKFNYLLCSTVVGVAGNFVITPDIVLNLTDPENYLIKRITLGYSYIIRGAVTLNNPRVAVQLNGVNQFKLPDPQFSNIQIVVGFWGASNEINFGNGLSIQDALRVATYSQNDAGYLIGDTIENAILIEWEYDAK